MQIENNLKQFTDEQVLLAVAGERRAQFFLAANGEINRIDEVEENIPEYEDSEGAFGMANNGEGTGGFQPEINNGELRKKFVHKFLEKLTLLDRENKITALFIFMPLEIHKMVEEGLSQDLSKKLKKIVAGDYAHAKPFELIEMAEKNTLD